MAGLAVELRIAECDLGKAAVQVFGRSLVVVGLFDSEAKCAARSRWRVADTGRFSDVCFSDFWCAGYGSL